MFTKLIELGDCVERLVESNSLAKPEITLMQQESVFSKVTR